MSILRGILLDEESRLERLIGIYIERNKLDKIDHARWNLGEVKAALKGMSDWHDNNPKTFKD